MGLHRRMEMPSWSATCESLRPVAGAGRFRSDRDAEVARCGADVALGECDDGESQAGDAAGSSGRLGVRDECTGFSELADPSPGQRAYNEGERIGRVVLGSRRRFLKLRLKKDRSVAGPHAPLGACSTSCPPGRLGSQQARRDEGHLRGLQPRLQPFTLGHIQDRAERHRGVEVHDRLGHFWVFDAQ